MSSSTDAMDYYYDIYIIFYDGDETYCRINSLRERITVGVVQ